MLQKHIKIFSSSNKTLISIHILYIALKKKSFFSAYLHLIEMGKMEKIVFIGYICL